MNRWTRGIMGDEPPYLTVGTEVSAKYKGAFCEAKVRKVVRSVKCKVTFKLGLGSAIVADDQVRGTLRVGSTCEVKHPDKKEFSEAILNKIQDCSQYTVVFDDGDITTLRRSALCLKSGRHFAESETLDQLPLTHPEHFSNPVIGGRKGRRSRQAHEDSSEEEGTVRRGKRKEEKEEDIGRMVCVELGDKKKQKDNWFPGLVVAPTAQDTVRIKVRDEYLVRSFKDGRYFTVPKKEATEFTREIGAKVENNTLKTAVEKALLFLDRDELPPHWDRDLLFGVDDSGASDSDGALDSDSSDDEPREEKDHFVAQLYKFMDDRGTPINKGPTIGNKDIDLYKLFKVVHKVGGYNRVTNTNQWKSIAYKVGFGQSSSSITNLVKQAYKKFLHSFEEFYRKLGCTMVNHPRGNRARQYAGRSLIRDCDRATPVNTPKDKDKAGTSAESSSDTVKEAGEAVVKLEGITSVPSSEDDLKKSKVDELPKESATKKDDKSKPGKKDVSSDNVPHSTKSTVKEETSNVGKVGKKEKEIVNENAKTVGTTTSTGSNKESVQSTSHAKGKQNITVSDTKQDTSFLDKPSLLTRREERLKEESKLAKTKEDKQKSQQHKSDRIKVLSEKAKVPVKDEPIEASEILKVEVKEETPKITEDEKSERSKKLPEKREEEEKQTRSKSKDDLASKKDSITPERRSRELEKRMPPRLKKPEEEEEMLNKRGRKRKDMDSKPNPEEGLGQLSSNIAVGVGDKLKVYYGPTHESKVTYEAKVIDMEKETFLVHYTGWNTRYDEWIKRSRIAENLSWTPSRAKRLRQQQSLSKASRSGVGKRGRPSTSGRDSVTHRPRSTTPSSVTSSSSRTKSPGTPAPRSTRPSLGFENRRRTRRMSGHTDVSLVSESESESESEPEHSETGIEPVRTRSRSERLGDKEQAANKSDEKEEVNKRPPKRMMSRKKDLAEVEAEDDKEDDSGEQVTETEIVNDPQVVEKRRSKRMRKPVGSSSTRKDDELKREPSTESEEELPQPKGRDFDLNQIRSELKGFEKAVKQPVDTPPTDSKEAQVVLDDKTGIIDVKSTSADNALENKTSEVVVNPCSVTNTDDIYEFKEPEPFDFEVRTKRDLLVPEERPKLNGKQPIKSVVEDVESKVEKLPAVRKKLVRNAPAKVEVKETGPLENSPKKRFRRTVGKKNETPTSPELKKNEPENVKEVSVESPTTHKNVPMSACEEAFDKLCESPVFRPASQPRRTPSPTSILGPNIEPLNLFTDLPGEMPEGMEEEDSEDRLVILDTDETGQGSKEPLFTYSQRHHEELLPTLCAKTLAPSTEAVASELDESQILPIINLVGGVYPALSKNINIANPKSIGLRKKNISPIVEKRVSKQAPNRREPAVGKKKEICPPVIIKETASNISKIESCQVIGKDLCQVMSEELNSLFAKGSTSPLINKQASNTITKKETTPVVAKKETSPLVGKKEVSPAIDKKDPVPVFKKELSPVITKKEPVLVTNKKEGATVTNESSSVTAMKESTTAITKDPSSLISVKDINPVHKKESSPTIVNKKGSSPVINRTELSPILDRKELSPVTVKKGPANIKEINPVVSKKEASLTVNKKESSPIVNKKETIPSANKKESSPAVKKVTSPVINKKESSPILSKKELTPPLTKKEASPLPNRKESSPVINKKELTPVINKKDSTPIINKKESTPVVNKKESTPIVNKKESTPVVNKKEPSTPVVNKKETSTPVVNKKESTPVVNKKETTPVVNKKESTVGNKKESTPVANKKESTVVNKKESTPVANKKESTPVVNKKESTPVVNKKESTPVVCKKESIPVVNKKEPTPVVNKKESTPVVNKKESTPVVNKKESTLVVNKKESTPVVKKKDISPVTKKGPNPAVKRKDVSPIGKRKDSTAAFAKKKKILPILNIEEMDIKDSKNVASTASEDASSFKDDGDIYADDPIGAAIQRVISQALTDEDITDFDVAAKVTNLQPEKKITKTDVQISAADSLRKESLKRKSGGRKPVLSQEFVEDTDSDSSEEEPRLVIAKIDEDDDTQSQNEESNSCQSLLKPPSIISGCSHNVIELYETNKQAPALEPTVLGSATSATCTKQDPLSSCLKREEPPHIEDGAKPNILSDILDKREDVCADVKTKKDDSGPSDDVCDKSDKLQNDGRSLAVLVVVEEKDDDLECNVPSLLCEETIPGSPTPIVEAVQDGEICKDEPLESKAAVVLEMPFASAPSCSSGSAIPTHPMETVVEPPPGPAMSVLPGAAAPVIENTPPTTPESSLSITSGSPMEECHPDMSPTMDNESVKSRRESFEGDSSAEGNKVENYSEEDSLLNIELSNSSDNRLQGQKSPRKKLNSDIEREIESSAPKKRRPSRKRSECDNNKRLKSLAGHANRLLGGDSDSDDTSENSTGSCLPLVSSENMLPTRSPRPSKYNFYVELDPELDGSQRIALLQQKLQELRKTYVSVKAELACIDRRRKKLRRREREDKASKSEVFCS